MRIAFATLAAMGIGSFAYASLIERNWYAVRRHRVVCLPPGSAPLRIVHLSDLHLRPRQRRKARFVASARALEPDIAVATGDLLADGRAAVVAAEAIAAIRPRLGGLFVLGGHDYFGPGPRNPLDYFRHEPNPHLGAPFATCDDLVEGLERAGWLFVNNRATELAGIEVVGLDDPYINRHDLSVASPRRGPGFRLALVHSPDAAADLARLGYDLILCGHTHGGQVRVPGFGALVTNSTLHRRYARGLHRFEGAWLHVNAGLGTSALPIRFACRPEICVLDLVPREE